MTCSDPFAMLDAHFRSMPPVAAMAIRVKGFDADVLQLSAPLSANVNDKGCAFGGSLASVMTLAAWGWLMLRLDTVGLVAEVYVADSQIRYLAPLYDEMLSEARLAPDQDWSSTLRTLRDRGRARIAMQSKVFDATGRTVASLSARFALILAPTVADAMA